MIKSASVASKGARNEETSIERGTAPTNWDMERFLEQADQKGMYMINQMGEDIPFVL
jgi:hypothetical protein